ncbi:MAG: DUF6351 family protein [Rubrivivax sp.]
MKPIPLRGAWLALALGSSAAWAASPPEIKVLSSRADMVSGGDALVEITWPAGSNPALAKLALNGTALTGVFALRPNGKYQGLVTGLRDGFNLLTARVPGAGAQLVITSHPVGGPIFSGPQLMPWACSTTSNPSLGQATDVQCNAPSAYRYMYRTTSNTFAAYDPAGPAPANLAMTTTDGGVTVPYIVRVERGTANRGIHEIAVLADPAKPWLPWDPSTQPGWNHKVLMIYGAGTSQTYRQGTPDSVLDHAALSAGFAVANSSMMVNSQHANFVTAAETTMMLKERIIERYGPIRYTIGQGGSGGALLQHLVADNYPGLLDGLRPTQDWEDSISGAYREFADSAAVTAAFTASSLTYTNAERAAIGGWGLANVNVFNIENGRVGDYNRPDDGTNCAGTDSYDPTAHPAGVRCTFQDFISSLIGTRPADGHAHLVYDNVGVQYGLKGLLEGLISVDKFVDVNVRAGGFDVNGRWQPQRSEMDPAVASILHRSGHVTYGKQLGDVPELAIRGTNNNDYHYPFRTVVNRARLAAANGHADNHVYWIQAPSGMSTLTMMDRWLANIEADARNVPKAQKVVENKPADLVSGCGISGSFVTDLAACDAQYPYFREPRTVAGDATTIYTMKCQLKPMSPGDYPGVVFTAEQWTALQGAFPQGVCDFSKPGVGFEPNVPWLNYKQGPGGIPAGTAPASVPLQ